MSVTIEGSDKAGTGTTMVSCGSDPIERLNQLKPKTETAERKGRSGCVGVFCLTEFGAVKRLRVYYAQMVVSGC